MKNIRDIFEGLLTSDISKVRAAEPIVIKEIDEPCFEAIKAYIESANNIIERFYVEPQLDQIEAILKSIGSAKLTALARSSAGRAETDFWYDLFNMIESLEDRPRVTPEKMELHRKWAAAGRMINELFKDSQIKKELLDNGVFKNIKGGMQLKWVSDDSLELSEAFTKKLERKLPKGSFLIEELRGGEKKITFNLESFVG